MKKSNLYFIHVPKTGGTALKTRTSKLLGFTKKPPSHISLSDLKAKMPPDLWDKTFKFCTIRDPHERFVSDFKQFLSKPKRDFKEAGYAMEDFSVDNFRKWMENIWYPFISGKPIKTKDPKLIAWMDKNASADSCFIQNIYHHYLFNDGFDDIDYFLDFRYLEKDLRLMATQCEQLAENLLSSGKDDFGGIKNHGPNSFYAEYWTAHLHDLFSEYNAKDIEFYQDLITKKSYENS